MALVSFPHRQTRKRDPSHGAVIKRPPENIKKKITVLLSKFAFENTALKTQPRRFHRKISCCSPNSGKKNHQKHLLLGVSSMGHCKSGIFVIKINKLIPLNHTFGKKKPFFFFFLLSLLRVMRFPLGTNNASQALPNSHH